MARHVGEIPVKTLTSRDPFCTRTREESRGRNRNFGRGGGRKRGGSRFEARDDGTIDNTRADPILGPDTANEDNEIQ